MQLAINSGVITFMLVLLVIGVCLAADWIADKLELED